VKPLRVVDLIFKDTLGEVWVKVAVDLSEQDEVEITAKLTENALNKIDREGLEAQGLCLLKLTDSRLPLDSFYVVATLEEKDDNPPKIYRDPYRIRDHKRLRFRLSRGERG
jgi:hypothetical protein